MTYQPLRTWISLDDLLSLELSNRVRYVRHNLPGEKPTPKRPHMTLDEFAAAVGAKNRYAPINWESGTRPRDYTSEIAALTPYPPEAFGAPGEAELLRQMYGRRLRQVEAEVAWLRGQLTRAAVLLSLELEPLEELAPAQSGDGHR